MFKVGDRVICIENREGQHDLILNDKIYTITDVVYCYLYLDMNDNKTYNYYRFILAIKTERKQKLKELCSK